MDTITIRQGETLQLPFEADDVTAVSVQFQVVKDGIIYIDELENFVTGKATIFTNDTLLEIGDYEYIVTIVYADGVVDILPDPSTCEEGDCDLPLFTVCKGAVLGIS
jgi:hypothetical protein